MADFSLAPDFVFHKKTNWDTLVSRFENGVEQRRARWGTAVKEWKLEYKNRPASEVTTVQTLFDNSKGAYSSFTWTNPVDSQEYTVRFKEDSLDVQAKAYGVYDFAFELIEVK